MSQTCLFAQPDDVESGGFGQRNNGGGGQVVIFHGPVSFNVAVRHVGGREFFVVAARLAGCDGCSQRVVPGI